MVLQWLMVLACLCATLTGQAQDSSSTSTCGLPLAGSPCDGTGPASQGNTTDTVQAAGNPIDVITGNKHQKETDMPALPGELGLEIVRYYNSADRQVLGLTGPGWRLSYETALYRQGNTLEIWQADGHRLQFNPVPDQPHTWQSAWITDGRLQRRQSAEGAGYVWHWTHGPAAGRALHFSAQGRLLRIVSPTGAQLTLERDRRGELLSVTDPQGRQLRLHYTAAAGGTGTRRLHAIDSPVGRFSYEYLTASTAPASPTPSPPSVSPRLWRVLQPSLDALPVSATAAGPIVREYHYEDPRFPYALTGISVQGQGSDGHFVSQRLSRYQYDTQGRAHVSIRHPMPTQAIRLAPLVDSPADPVFRLELRYQAPQPGTGTGYTWVRDGQGRETRFAYRWRQGRWQLLEALGAPCPGCGPVNRRWDYDTTGRLNAMEWGEPVSVRNGQPQSDWQPLRRLDWKRDAAGRVVTAQLHSMGRHGTARSPSQHWTWQYHDPRWPDKPTQLAHHSVVAGRSHTHSWTYHTSGQPTRYRESGYSPVSRGPAGQLLYQPSAIQRQIDIHYETVNGRQLPVSIQGPYEGASPGSATPTWHWTWDATGSRLLSVRTPEGDTQRLSYEAHSGLLQGLQRGDGWSIRWWHNRWQQATAWQVQSPDTEAPVWGLRWLTDANGWPTTLQSWDPSSPQTPGRTLLMQGHDGQGRLSWQADWRGRMKVWHEPSPDGSPARVSVWLGRMHRDWPMVMLDDTGRPTQDAHTHQTTCEWDDFGRCARLWDPDRGARHMLYDALDRLLVQQDADGFALHFQYDVRGRLRQQSLVAASADPGRTPDEQPPIPTEWKYQRDRLSEIRSDHRTEVYRHDARGRLSERQVTLDLVSGGQLHWRDQFERDTRGRLSGQRLPDGSWLRYQRDPSGQVTAVRHNPVHHTALRWLARERTVVEWPSRDAVGWSAARSGNGVQSQRVRSRNGQLQELTHHYPDRVGIRHRYLWSEQGWLLRELTEHTPADQSSWHHGYDRWGRLLISRQQSTLSHQSGPTSSHHREWRHAYGPGQQLWLQALLSQSVPDPSGPVPAPDPRPPSAVPTTRWQTDVEHRAEWSPEHHHLLAWAGRERHYTRSGLTRQDGRRHYDWDGLGRLLRIRDRDPQTGQDRLIAEYAYDHRGWRQRKTVDQRTRYVLHNLAGQIVGETDDRGQLLRQYVVVGGQYWAFIDSPSGRPTADPRQPPSLWADLWRLLQSWWPGEHESARWYWIHSNHLGAPEHITDAQARVVWEARYDPFGQAHIRRPMGSGPELDLRLPGQWLDQESGLHYSLYRYYEPDSARFLSPDPVGYPDGPNPYAYAGFNPLSQTDPQGALLFAFDGTNNDESEPSTYSNVVKFKNLYQDGGFYYITGPGTTDPASGIRNPFLSGGTVRDLMKSITGKDRVNYLVGQLAKTADQVPDGEPITIDVVGFSRGAAEARDFANQVANATQDGWYRYNDGKSCQRVELRFMGLWDTVLSWHSGEYNLAIPGEFAYVAHLVALNEYRRLFPVESIIDGPVSSKVVEGQVLIEQGLLGSHSDIGGSFADGELSWVALAWMVDEARLAGVALNDINRTIPAKPALHDKSTNLTMPNGPAPNDSSEDRVVRYSGGTTVQQRKAPINGMTYQNTVKFIDYSRPAPILSVSAQVDAKAYLAWLSEKGVALGFNVP